MIGEYIPAFHRYYYLIGACHSYLQSLPYAANFCGDSATCIKEGSNTITTQLLPYADNIPGSSETLCNL